jgi:hypothetical protein
LRVQLGPGMRESDTYQYILEEGATSEVRKMLLLQGELLWGPPDATVRATLEGITELERLERMGVRVIRASGWQELLETP